MNSSWHAFVSYMTFRTGIILVRSHNKGSSRMILAFSLSIGDGIACEEFFKTILKFVLDHLCMQVYDLEIDMCIIAYTCVQVYSMSLRVFRIDVHIAIIMFMYDNVPCLATPFLQRIRLYGSVALKWK